MNIVLYRFNKRENSTKRPADDLPGQRVISNVTINDNGSSVCSIDLTIPVMSGTTDIRNDTYNYAYVPKFSRYYWIHDWQYHNNGTITATMIVDPLASFKEYIVSGEGFVRYTGNLQLENRRIIDTRYKTINSYYCKDSVVSMQDWFTSRPENGTFVISVVSTTAPIFGSVNYYVVDYANMAVLVTNMVNSFATLPTQGWKDVSLSGELLKEIVSPMQYITSCKWFPIVRAQLPYDSSQAEEIKLGIWATGAYGYKVTGTSSDYFFSYNINVPAPDSQTEPNYSTLVNAPPYAEYNLYNNLMGLVPIDPIIASNVGFLTVYFRFSLISGKIRFEISAPTSDYQHDTTKPLMAVTDSVLSVDLPLTSITTNIIQAGKDVLGSAANLASFIPSAALTAASGGLIGPNFDALSKGLTGIIDAAQNAISPRAVSSGASNGNFFADIAEMILEVRINPTMQQYPTLYGVPRGYYESLAAHSGCYVNVHDFHFTLESAASAVPFPLKKETDAIVSFLQSGVYLE